MKTIERFAGTYQGTGTWHDAVGKSSSYTVHQTNLETADGFDVTFKHDFEDGAVVEARFTMTWLTANLFRVDVSGHAVGNGYVFDGYCHYHMNVADRFVEASYRSSDDGLEVFGSSSKNAEGNYIAWRESLRRAAT
jgi:hypothetical protein